MPDRESLPLVRSARENDLAAIIVCDPRARESAERRDWLKEALRKATFLVAEENGKIAGLLVLEHGFFGHAFVALVVVHPEARRRGIALLLLEAAEARCRTGKFFTSTNVSNAAARELFQRAGFLPSGRIENLDEGDPELIYFKALSR